MRSSVARSASSAPTGRASRWTVSRPSGITFAPRPPSRAWACRPAATSAGANQWRAAGRVGAAPKHREVALELRDCPQRRPVPPATAESRASPGFPPSQHLPLNDQRPYVLRPATVRESTSHGESGCTQSPEACLRVRVCRVRIAPLPRNSFAKRYAPIGSPTVWTAARPRVARRSR